MNFCPSLFKPTTAVDGILTRIRVPLGIISLEQIEAIAQISEQFSNSSIQITNRANIQIRTSEPFPNSVLKDLQKLGLAAHNPDLDHLRNIMISPTAGIDPEALLDTRPLAIAWLKYIDNHPELAILSPKFSIGIDGGEGVSIGNRPNDIILKAVKYRKEVYFSLHIVNTPTDLLINPDQALNVLSVLTEIYRNFTIQKSFQNLDQIRSPRLRELIKEWGMEVYLKTLEDILDPHPQTLCHWEKGEEISNASTLGEFQHLGVHSQIQWEYSYMGVVIPLGRLSSSQFRSLGNISKSLRLTPFQNAIAPNIPNQEIESVKTQISELGLSISDNHPFAAMVACSGITGCKSSATDTQSDARAIAEHLQTSIILDRPINIHLTGCEKSCAQHYPSDITLLGVDADMYKVFVGDRCEEVKFGKELQNQYPASELPNLVKELIQTYQTQRENPDQTFKEFMRNYD